MRRLSRIESELKTDFLIDAIKPAYIKERAYFEELAVKAVSSEAKKDALKKLSDLDDLDSWFTDRLETTKQEYAAYLESDACKAFRSALANAESAAQSAAIAADQDSKAVGRGIAWSTHPIFFGFSNIIILQANTALPCTAEAIFIFFSTEMSIVIVTLDTIKSQIDWGY